MIADLQKASALALDERRLARRHSLSALAISALHTLICLFFLQGGYFVSGLGSFVTLFAVIWAGNLLLASLVLSGFSTRWRDQSLSLPWNLWLTAGFLTSAYFVDDFRLSTVLFFFAAMLLLSFRQRMLVLMGVAALASAGYLGVIILALQERSIYLNLSVEVLQWLIFTLTALGFAVTGAGINALRGILTRKNRELGEALVQVREMAIRDELTGMFNRRHIMDVLRQQQALADSGDYGFALCFLDLDHFKHTNDTYGHGVGDEVLRRFSGVADECLRDADYTGRMGGEEFVLVLTQAGLEEACMVTNRVRTTLAERDYSDLHPDLRVTVSAGVALYRPGESLDETLARADQCLYQAKATGRNRVVNESELEADPEEGARACS